MYLAGLLKWTSTLVGIATSTHSLLSCLFVIFRVRQAPIELQEARNVQASMESINTFGTPSGALELWARKMTPASLRQNIVSMLPIFQKIPKESPECLREK